MILRPNPYHTRSTSPLPPQWVSSRVFAPQLLEYFKDNWLIQTTVCTPYCIPTSLQTDYHHKRSLLIQRFPLFPQYGYGLSLSPLKPHAHGNTALMTSTKNTPWSIAGNAARTIIGINRHVHNYIGKAAKKLALYALLGKHGILVVEHLPGTKPLSQRTTTPGILCTRLLVIPPLHIPWHDQW